MKNEPSSVPGRRGETEVLDSIINSDQSTLDKIGFPIPFTIMFYYHIIFSP